MSTAGTQGNMEVADNAYMNPILYIAASSGDFEPFERINKELSIITTPDKSTILHIHLTPPSLPSTSFIEQVLNKCPSLVLQANVAGDIPLHVAAKYGHHSAVEYLINHIKGSGSEGDVKKMLRKTNDAAALHVAVQYEERGLVRILAKEDPDYLYSTNKLGESPLFMRYSALVEELLISCRVLDFGGPHGMTALHIAAMDITSNSTEMILMRNQTLVCKVDDYGWTPLHYAAYYNNYVAVQMLLEKDYRAAYMGDAKRNMTPLHLAACRGNTGVLKQIVTLYPSSCELVDFKGRNVLHFAILSSRFEDAREISKFLPVKKLLLGRDDDGNTPLHLFLALYPEPGDLETMMESYSVVDPYVRVFLDLQSPDLIKDEIMEMSKTFDEAPYVNGIVALPSSLINTSELKRQIMKEKKDTSRAAHLIKDL